MLRYKEKAVDVPCVNLNKKEFFTSNEVVRQVRWSRGASLDCYLIVLSSDECLRIYNAMTGSTLSTYCLSYHNARRNLPSRAALGEIPVDFIPLPSESDNSCPLLILWGTGEVKKNSTSENTR